MNNSEGSKQNGNHSRESAANDHDAYEPEDVRVNNAARPESYISPATYLCTQEIDEAWKRALYFAAKLLSSYKSTELANRIFEPEDLVSIAYEKTLLGVRPWSPEQCPELFVHLAGCIKSEINNTYHSLAYRAIDHRHQAEEVIDNNSLFVQQKETPEAIQHRQSAINMAEDFVQKKKPELSPLAHYILAEGITKPKELAEILGLSENEIKNQKQAFRRLFEKKFVKYYIAHFRVDMCELVELIDAIHHKKSRKADILSAFLDMDIDEVRRKRNQLDKFINEIISEIA